MKVRIRRGDNMLIDAVFEGGGVKAIGLAGALHVVEQRGFVWNRLAGTSSGAIIASLLASGYRSEEIKQIIMDLSFKDLIRPTWVQRIPLVGKWIELIFHYGIYSSNHLERYIARLLLKKGIRTFDDLPEGKLKVIASDISLGRLLVLPDDLERYGFVPKHFSVAKAVVMSSSLPFYFFPTILKAQDKRQDSYVVDGGLLSNFPIWVFDDNQTNPTFGFRMVGKNDGEPAAINDPISYVQALISTMLEAHDMKYMEEHDKLRSILVPTLDVKTTDFNLPLDKKIELFNAGVQAATKFLGNWNLNTHTMNSKNAIKKRKI
jgi:NTE family protein